MQKPSAVALAARFYLFISILAGPLLAAAPDCPAPSAKASITSAGTGCADNSCIYLVGQNFASDMSVQVMSGAGNLLASYSGTALVWQDCHTVTFQTSGAALTWLQSAPGVLLLANNRFGASAPYALVGPGKPTITAAGIGCDDGACVWLQGTRFPNGASVRLYEGAAVLQTFSGAQLSQSGSSAINFRLSDPAVRNRVYQPLTDPTKSKVYALVVGPAPVSNWSNTFEITPAAVVGKHGMGNYFYYDAACFKNFTGAGGATYTKDQINDCAGGGSPKLVLQELYDDSLNANTVVQQTVGNELDRMRAGGIESLSLPIWILGDADVTAMYFSLNGLSNRQQKGLAWLMQEVSKRGFRTLVVRLNPGGNGNDLGNPIAWTQWNPTTFERVKANWLSTYQSVIGNIDNMKNYPQTFKPLRVIYDLGGEVGGFVSQWDGQSCKPTGGQALQFCSQLLRFATTQAVPPISILPPPAGGDWSVSTLGCSVLCSDNCCGQNWKAQELAYRQVVPNYGSYHRPVPITTYSPGDGHGTIGGLASLKREYEALYGGKARAFLIETQYDDPRHLTYLNNSGVDFFYSLGIWPVSRAALGAGNWVVDRDFVDTVTPYDTLPIFSP